MKRGFHSVKWKRKLNRITDSENGRSSTKDDSSGNRVDAQVEIIARSHGREKSGREELSAIREQVWVERGHQRVRRARKKQKTVRGKHTWSALRLIARFLAVISWNEAVASSRNHFYPLSLENFLLDPRSFPLVILRFIVIFALALVLLAVLS